MLHLHRPYCDWHDDKTNLKTTITTIVQLQQQRDTSTFNTTQTLVLLLHNNKRFFFPSLFSTRVRRSLLLVTNIREIRIEIGIKRSNLRDISIKLLNQRHVFHHVIRHSRLLILVHLLNNCSVPVKHRLNLPETLVQCRPRLGIAVFCVLHVGVVAVCRSGWGTASALTLLGAVVVGVFHGGFCGGRRWINCGHVSKRKTIMFCSWFVTFQFFFLMFGFVCWDVSR